MVNMQRLNIKWKNFIFMSYGSKTEVLGDVGNFKSGKHDRFGKIGLKISKSYKVSATASKHYLSVCHTLI